jgi:hypothetical protein
MLGRPEVIRRVELPHGAVNAAGADRGKLCVTFFHLLSVTRESEARSSPPNTSLRLSTTLRRDATFTRDAVAIPNGLSHRYAVTGLSHMETVASYTPLSVANG